ADEIYDLLWRVPGARGWLDTVLPQALATLLLPRTAQPHGDGKLQFQVVARRHDRFGDLVATRYATEHVEQDTLDLGVHEDHRECILHNFCLRAAADIAEVGRRSASPLHEVHCPHA